jgi:hypothetical protein
MILKSYTIREGQDEKMEKWKHKRLKRKNDKKKRGVY